MRVARLSAEFHRCLSHFEARRLSAPDTFFDLLPRCGGSSSRDRARRSRPQLRSITPSGPVDDDVVLTVATTKGFVTEHVETQYTPARIVTARRLHLVGRRVHLCGHDLQRRMA